MPLTAESSNEIKQLVCVTIACNPDVLYVFTVAFTMTAFSIDSKMPLSECVRAIQETEDCVNLTLSSPS
jgi:hypothetical protein